MAIKHKRYTVKTTSRMIVIFLFFSIVISTLSYTLIHNLRQISEMKKELVVLDAEKLVLIEEKEALDADIKRLSDPLYVARYAREKYFYSKEGELVLRFEN